MQPVTLHIGAAKTGSTFLQRWLEKNAALLAQHGLHTIPLMSCHRLAVACIRDAKRLERDDAVQLLKLPLDPALQALREGARDPALSRSVLSSEYFPDTDPAAVAALLGEQGLVVEKVLCFVRRQDRACASGLNQVIKVAGQSRLPRAFRYRPGLDWHRHYTRWREAFPSATVVFRNYDKHRREHTLLDVFKEEIGFGADTKGDSLPRVEQSNPSLNRDLLEVCRLANARGHTGLGTFLMKAQINGFDGPRYELTQEQASALEAVYLESNGALVRALESDELRELTQPGWKSDGTGLTGEAASAVLVDLLAEAVSGLPAPGSHGAHVASERTNRSTVAPASSSLPSILRRPDLYLRALTRRTVNWMLLPIFDSDYYLRIHPDVAAAKVTPWLHYLANGRKEGRRCKPPLLRFSGHVRRFSPDKETILVVLHEGSRTGAPIIGYNLVLGLVDRYNVVVLSLTPGPVAEACSTAGAYVAAPPSRTRSWRGADLLVQRLAESFSFTFAIVNAFGSRFVLRQLARMNVPVVSLIHEFAGNIHPLSDLGKVIDWSDTTVSP